MSPLTACDANGASFRNVRHLGYSRTTGLRCPWSFLPTMRYAKSMCSGPSCDLFLTTLALHVGAPVTDHAGRGRGISGRVVNNARELTL
jgi:hypothetical protein